MTPLFAAVFCNQEGAMDWLLQVAIDHGNAVFAQTLRQHGAK